MILEIIGTREKAEHEFTLQVAELHASSIIAGLAGLADNKKSAKAISKYAQKLSFLPRKKASEMTADDDLPTVGQIASMFGARSNR